MRAFVTRAKTYLHLVNQCIMETSGGGYIQHGRNGH